MTRVGSTLRELVEAGAGELRWAEGCARENPRREAALLLQAAVGLDRAQLAMHGGRSAPPDETALYWDMVRRRARGFPLQLLLGETGFHDVMLTVEPGVFIPRPETEQLVEEAAREIDWHLLAGGADIDRQVTVLDLCTGTGAVAVALARRFHGDPRVVLHAGDWSVRAVHLARRNASRNDVEIAVRRSNLFSAFADLENGLDVIIANPPYVAPHEEESLPVEVRMGDPADALFDPEGGTGFHRRIAERAGAFLRPGGLLAMEIGESQGAAVAAELRSRGYEDVAVLPDLARRDRFVRGRTAKSTRSF